MSVIEHRAYAAALPHIRAAIAAYRNTINGETPMAYDERITNLAAIAAEAAGKNAEVAPQLLMADITFALADAVKDGRIILGTNRESENQSEN